MRVSIHQPQFLPWSGFWAKVAASQVHCIYTGVKFDKSDYQHRVTIADAHWIGMQVGDSERNKLICDVKLSDTFSLKKAAITIRQKFMTRRFAHRTRLEPIVAVLEEWEGDSMCRLNIRLMRLLTDVLKMPWVEFYEDSLPRQEMGKVERLRDVLDLWPGAEYYMGQGALEYMGYEDMPGHEVWVQRQRSKPSSHSVLQLIAEHPDPLSVIEASWCWTNKDGRERAFRRGVAV